MDAQPPPAAPFPAAVGLGRHIAPGLAILVDASDLSAACHADDWAFAVEIDQLLSAGLSYNALRWLAYNGYVRHADEATRTDSPRRTFRRSAPLAFTRDTCFVLTPAGAEVARQILTAAEPPGPKGGCALRLAEPGGTAGVPSWDPVRRELRWRAALVKQFRLPAPNQELILAVFEEEGWAEYIDDPLPSRAGQDPKQRLHDTIKSLNRNQRHRVLHFRGDGSGRRVGWEPAAALAPYGPT
jgi:hypothetical protein